METVGSAETLVTTYRITRHHITKDSNLHIWPPSDLLIYGPLDEGISNTEWKINWTGRGGERQWPNLRYCPGVCLIEENRSRPAESRPEPRPFHLLKFNLLL
jgi:hypothetical protein